jgi:HAE1 family hydrophobic/amphiphilic exporter-1
MVITLNSDNNKYSTDFIENYMSLNIVPQIKRVSGVGDAMMFGADYSMRIWLKPEVMAQYGLMPSDISTALSEQNIEAAPGQFGENGDQSFQYVMRYKGRLVEETEFENIIIRAYSDGKILYLGDVADIELGRVSYGFSNKIDGMNGVGILMKRDKMTDVLLHGSSFLSLFQHTGTPPLCQEKQTILPKNIEYIHCGLHFLLL